MPPFVAYDRDVCKQQNPTDGRRSKGMVPRLVLEFAPGRGMLLHEQTGHVTKEDEHRLGVNV
jgi:hypothetical protein